MVITRRSVRTGFAVTLAAALAVGGMALAAPASGAVFLCAAGMSVR